MQLSRRGFDVAAGVVLLLLGAFVWREGAAIPPSFLDTAFGTGYLVMLAGGALSVLACFLILEAVRGGRTAGQLTFDARLARPALTASILALFVLNLTFGLVPFYPSAAAMIFAIALGLGERAPRAVAIAAAAALAATAAAWVVFTQVFVVLIG
ncbi:tripartite tricarboxylate transporter TctB family protein [Jannaschia sp. LMIT008]|uniref:tripartite tricarboxylate transporter TctB family protein n=1 Tax=Jannaschia maritima TaxID=3032585 RepID=UPI002811F6F8|nr:tripartite tricarboxylate transporter TctB family protein [Jannaschia sp. LMIT008]